MFDSFRLCEPCARLFDALAGRVGASIAGRNTYEDSGRSGDDGTPHPAAPLFVLSHRPAPRMAGRQRLVATGLADAVAAARDAADGKDIALMGGVLVTEAVKAGLVDELILHQVPVLLGAGRPTSAACPIPGTKSPRRLEENAAAADVDLSRQDVEELDDAISRDAVRGARYPEQMMALLDT